MIILILYLFLFDQLENDVNELRQKLQNLKIETQNNLLVSNSLFQSNQKELEELKSTLKRDEKEKELYEDKAKNIARETSQIIQSIKNIYFRCNVTVKNKTNANNNINLNINMNNNTTTNNTNGILNSNTANNNNTNQISNSNQSNNNINELLSVYLDIIHSRISDLIEISNEYKYHANNSTSNSVGPTNAGPSLISGPYSIDPTSGAVTPGGNSHFGGFAGGGISGASGLAGNSEVLRKERNLMSKSAPSSQLKKK